MRETKIVEGKEHMGEDRRKPLLGSGVYVHQSAVVVGNVTLGEQVSIWPQAVLRGDEGRIEVGAQTNIQDGTIVHMTGGLSHALIGSRVTIGHGCILHGCKIGDETLIGMGATILDNAEIGEHAIIGAQSLVTQGKVIPAGMMAHGNPARVIRALTSKELTIIEYSWRHYVERATSYREGVFG